MKATLTVIYDHNDNVTIATVVAQLLDVNIASSNGDKDGRKWLQIDGCVDENGLRAIIGHFTSRTSPAN